MPTDRWPPDGPVTILFTDVEGSTALHTALGEEGAQAVLRACEEVVRREVAEHGGRAIKSLGDGLMVAFTSPRRAVTCSVAIGRALDELAERDPSRSVRVRCGLHTGEVTEHDGDLLGVAVNAAARICTRARGGETLVSDVVRQLCGSISEASFQDRGRLALKGFPERWHLYRVVPAERPQPVGTLGLTPFVGRTQALAELRGRLDQAVSGRGSVVLIAGEPGVGKTRLTQELTAHARRRGLQAFTGHCYETGGDLPYMPWVEILEAATRELPAASLRELLGENAAALAQMVPELRRRLPDIPALVELPADQQRRFLFNSVREYMARVAGIRPHVLVLDDVHWADDSTLLLLEHVSDWLEHVPILVLCTYRDLPIHLSPRLADTMTGLLRRHQATRITLERLTEAEVEEMLQLLSGQPPPPEVTAAIWGDSEGNAFLVEEVYRHLSESGRLLDERGRFRPDLSIGELDIPANVRLVIGQRLQRLGEPTRRMLGFAALIGRHVGFDVLSAVGEVEGDELVEAMEEATRARIVVEETAASEPRYRFGHELIRQTLLAEVSAARRQRQHLRIADALEGLHADPGLQATEIARHLVQSGSAADAMRTAHYLTLAGDRAQTAAAYEEALRHYGQALGRLPPLRDRRRADLLLKIGLTRRSLGQWDDALAAWDEALSILEELGEVEALPALCWELCLQLGWAYRFPEMEEVTRRGLAAVGDRESPHRARLLAMAGIAAGAATRFEEATRLVGEARRLAELAGDPQLHGDVGFVETVHHYFYMQLPETVEAGRRASDRLRAAGALWNLADTLAFLDVGLVYQGRFAESDVVHLELEPLVERLGHRAAAGVASRNHFATTVAREADLEALARQGRIQAAIARETRNPGTIAFACTLQGVVEHWRGAWSEARARFEEGVRQAMPFWYGPHHGFLLVLLAHLGEAEEVRARLDELEPRLPSAFVASTLGSQNLAVLAAEAVSLLGDAERARALHPLVVRALATGTVMRQVDGRLLQTIAGMAAATAGMWVAAEEHFEAALRQAEELPHLLERPHVRHHYGHLLARRGAPRDRERAASLLAEAVCGYAAIGMPRHREMADRLLEDLAAGRLGGAGGG